MKTRPITPTSAELAGLLDGTRMEIRRQADLSQLVIRLLCGGGLCPAGIGDHGRVFVKQDAGGEYDVPEPGFELVTPFGRGVAMWRRTSTNSCAWDVVPTEPVQLWVREEWMAGEVRIDMGGAPQVFRGPPTNRADLDDRWLQAAWHRGVDDPGGWPIRYGWMTARVMPEWAARLRLDVVRVRLERVDSVWTWCVEVKKGGSQWPSRASSACFLVGTTRPRRTNSPSRARPGCSRRRWTRSTSR